MWFRYLDLIWFPIKGRIIFYEEGGSEDFMGRGPHFFPNLKRGGGHVFFQSLISNIFFKKRYANIRNQSISCTTEPLFFSLSNTDLQRFCLIHKPHTESKTHAHT